MPIIVGAPQLRRYTAFGNLFAAYRGVNYRIDRHPVMSRHPVSPMHEADLLVHLSHQTALRPALLDLADLGASDLEARTDRLAAEADMLLIDVADRQTQRSAGGELWRLIQRDGAFVAGSSGVEYALLPVWADAGLTESKAEWAPLPPADRIAVVSGSVSPTTENQIRFAGGQGFEALAVAPVELAGESGDAAIEAAARAGLAVLKSGRSVILYTALGPAADRGAEIDRSAEGRHRLGRGLGEILKRLVLGAGLKRAVIAGGDTSSHALGRLGVDALTVRMPLTQSPGSPLCLAHSGRRGIDQLEIAMKGGQIGLDDYFCTIRDGQPGGHPVPASG